MHSNDEMREMKLGLERIAEIDAALGSPSKAFPTIHVAGTNGKGSVSWKIALGLQKMGKRVGLFSSPHISDITERVRINLEPVDHLDLELPYEMTYFETITLAAFQHFRKEGVDCAVIETGLGGRLDATNIIQPQLCVITSIGYDHMQYLGESLEEIAFEKAGIIKEKVPVVIGPNAKPRYIFERVARDKGSPLLVVEGEFAHFEEENQAIAQTALELLGYLGEPITEAPPCRFEVHGSVVYDVAHNLPGMHALFQRLEQTFPNKTFRIVAAFSEGKDVESMQKFLKQQGPLHLQLVDHPRVLPLGTSGAFEEAQKLATANDEILVVCGTFFMMDALQKIDVALAP